MVSADELLGFHEDFIYAKEVFLLHDVARLDRDTHEIDAVVDTNLPLPIARYQRGDPVLHPRHVSAPDLLLMTGNMGCLHAYFFHGCNWSEGWVGFGNRIHRADFKSIATLGPPLRLFSKEKRSRTGPERVVIRYEFEFFQDDRLVYVGDQTAQFFKQRPLAKELA